MSNVQKSNTKKRAEFLQKFQKPLVYTILFIFVAIILYSLFFMTPLYGLYQYADDGNFTAANAALLGIDINEYFEIYGGNLEAFRVNISGKPIAFLMAYFLTYTKQVQYLNNLLFYMGIIGIIVTLSLFIYRSQLRKKYYLTNVIAHFVVSFFGLLTAGLCIYNLAYYLTEYRKIDFNLINAFLSDKSATSKVLQKFYDTNTCDWVFIIGFVLMGILIVVSILNVVFVAMKLKNQRQIEGPKERVVIDDEE